MERYYMLFQSDTTAATNYILRNLHTNVKLTMVHTTRLASNLCRTAKMAKPRYANTQVSNTIKKPIIYISF